MEAPSEYLSLFVHWFTWADYVGSAVIVPLAASLLCCNQVTKVVACCAPFVCFISMIVLLLFICRKRQWFRSDPGHHNPYKTVLKVLNFARKHKYPLQRSAFTYCDDERPSRLDFGKERFGGPFTTAQVEDVKTLMRILLILVCLGPVYVLEVPNSVFGFPLISVHIAHKSQKYCDASWIIIESGCLRYIISAVVFPIYIMVLFSTKREKPKILTRLVIGILLYLSGVLCLLVTDVVGHTQMEANVNNISNPCVFNIKFNITDGIRIPLLGLPVASLIPTNIFLGIGPLIVYTSSLEFISAQSPHNMKGLLVGLNLTIRSFFQLISSFALLPFSLKSIWESQHMREHPPVTNCGFGYLLFTCVVSVIGLILLSLVAKRYKNRERDDRPYNYQHAEDAIIKQIEQRRQSNILS